jgi:hypothetical protein
VGYDLYFIAPTPAVPDRAAFERHFDGREHYAVAKGTASYTNEDTDASFSFDCLPSGSPALPDLPGPRPWARFTLALPRPSFFAEESMPELRAFTEQFGDAVVRQGGAGVETTASFLRSWEDDNRAACGPFPVGAPPGERPPTLPRAQILAVWQWNYGRKARQAEEGNVLFVPRIWFVRTDEGVGTCVVWPDVMAARIPQVDAVVFSRGTSAPHEGLSQRSDVAVLPWSVVAGAITGPVFYDSQIANWRVTDRAVLTGLAKAVSKGWGASDLPEFLTADRVLDREGFATAR